MQYYVVTSSSNANLHPGNYSEIVDVDQSYENIVQPRNGSLHNHSASAEKPDVHDVVECHSAGCSSPASSLKSAGDAPWSPGASEVPKITKLPRVQLAYGYGLSFEEAQAKMVDPHSPSAHSLSNARRVSVEDAEDSKYDEPLNLSIPRRHEDDYNKQKGTQLIGDNHKEYSGKDQETANSRVQYVPVLHLEDIVRSRVPSPSQSLNRQDNESLKTKNNGDQGNRSLTDDQTHKIEYDPPKSLQETTDTERMQNESIPSPEPPKSFDHSENLKKQFASQNFVANSNKEAIKKKKRKKNGSSKNHMCPYCSKGFPLPWKLKIHLRVHTGEKPYQCHVCGKRFSVQCNLRDHIQLHTGNRPWKCNKCPAKFSWPSQLKAHARVHSGEKPYKCQYCPMSFAWSSSRTHHERGHRGEKNYECKTCSTKFQRKSALLNHLRTHYGVKQFVCKFCNRLYSHKNSLKQHERKHTGEAPYICSCGEKFQTARNFRKHQSVLHNSEYPFICQVCLLNFKSERDLAEHNQILHQEKEGHREHDTKDCRSSPKSDSNDYQNRQELLELASPINDDKIVKHWSRKTTTSDTEYQNTTSIKDTESNYVKSVDNTVDFTNSDKLTNPDVQNLSQKSSPRLDTVSEDSKSSTFLKDDIPQSSSPLQVEKPLDFSSGDKTSGTPIPTTRLSSNMSKESSADFGLDLRKVSPEQREHDCATELLPRKSAFRDVRGQNSPTSRLQNRFQRLESHSKTDPLVSCHKSYHQIERLEVNPIYNPPVDDKDNPHLPPYKSHAFPHSPLHDRLLAEHLVGKLPPTQHGYLAEIFRTEERRASSLRQLLKQQPQIDALAGRYVYPRVYQPLELKQGQDSENNSHYGVPEDSCQIHIPHQIKAATYDQLHSEYTSLVQRLGDLYGKV